MVSLLYLLFRRALAVAALRLRLGEFKELKRAIIRVAVSGNSVVLVDETSELVAAADLPAGRSCLLLGLGRAELERTMRPLGVVVVDVDAQHPFEVASVQDQQPVETVGAHGADEAFGAIAFAFGARTGVFTIRIRSLRKTSSKEPLYLLSRSRIRKRMPCLAKSKPRLRACSVTQPPVGLVVQPASQTRRRSWAMKNSA